MALITVMVSDTGYSVVKGGGNLTFTDYNKDGAIPADDDREYLERIVVAMNQAMGFVTREVEATKALNPSPK